MTNFCVDLFRETSKENYIVYGWGWNSLLTRASIYCQLTVYDVCGIRGLYILPEPADLRPENLFTFLYPSCMTEEFISIVEYADKKQKSSGLNVGFAMKASDHRVVSIVLDA